jgi:hypothetical protein
MMIIGVKYWRIFFRFIYTPCYISNDENGTEIAAGKTGQEVGDKLNVSSVHEIDGYTKEHIMF